MAIYGNFVGCELFGVEEFGDGVKYSGSLFNTRHI
jgi:hypothetical protein